MADFIYGSGHDAPASRSVASFANWMGAAASLALIVGVGVWGYKLISRDVSGVPIVAAMDGPMRIAPDKPGGQLADHQGLAVNRVAGSGTAAPPADRLVLAPRPAGLAEEDVANGLIQPARPRAVQASLGTDRPSLGEDPQVSIPADSPLAQNAEIDALVAQLTDGATPLTPLEPGASKPVITQLANNSAPDGPGLRKSLRPKLRPGGLRVASLDPVLPTAKTVSEVDPATLPAGTRLVQIGAFDTPEAARKSWDKLDLRFGDYLEGKDRVIQKASSGGRVFYRLRAHGFADLSDARRFCAALVSGNVDCIPVVTR